jgi:hypothetical protein
MYPKTVITIKRRGPNAGQTKIEVLEKSDQCHKISDLSKRVGKVLSDEEKEHTPVYQDIHQKN